MFCPTVIGSPLGNACSIVRKYEEGSRSYYSSAIVLMGTEEGHEFLDSAITIRTMEIDAHGEVTLRAGATLVKDSDPASEVEECKAKLRGALSSLAPQGGRALPPRLLPLIPRAKLDEVLEQRNKPIGRFWLVNSAGEATPEHSRFRSALLMNNEDDFVMMLEHILRQLGLKTQVLPWDKWGAAWAAADHATTLAVVGPGPGDPNADEAADGKMATVKRNVDGLIKDPDARFLAVCLGHQILSRALGFEVPRRDVPMQGTQEEVTLFGTRRKVGFYNSFCPSPGANPGANLAKLGGGGEVSVKDGKELIAYRVPGKAASCQFHPESILTQEGVAIIGDLVATVAQERQPSAEP